MQRPARLKNEILHTHAIHFNVYRVLPDFEHAQFNDIEGSDLKGHRERCLCLVHIRKGNIVFSLVNYNINDVICSDARESITY